ncbi:MAG: GvpL/GvpF family gas vesicle protein [candidate division NC10 bacterium]|nr:GvpL/GvpF family gas vesicle protein [candidate division NC10 bacterium]
MQGHEGTNREIKMAQRYYLYGVVEASDQRGWGAVGLERQAVSPIPFREIAAVVNPWTSDVVPATPENCLAHERVLSDLIKIQTVLPFEFGTIAPDVEAVSKLLRRNYSRFRRALDKLSGTVEVSVTASWHDMKVICEEVVKAHPMIATYKREIIRKPYDQTYQDRLRIGQIVAGALETKRHLEGEKLYNVLRKGVVGVCQAHRGEPLGENVIFTGAFLVKRRAYPDFERSLLELGSRYDSRVDFKYTDALPPYHFADLKIVV